jgi:large subunit ribosomal protein L2
MKVGDKVVYSDTAPIKEGNKLALGKIPVGIALHNLEFRPGSKAQVVKSAGSAAFIQSMDGDKVTIKLPSGELRLFSALCTATIGQLGNADHSNQKLTKAGDSRHRGIRPSVRGVPESHSHPQEVEKVAHLLV